MTTHKIKELRDFADRMESSARYKAGVGHLGYHDTIQVDGLRDQQRIVDLIRKAAKEVEAK